MKKHEAKLTTDFQKWLKHYWTTTAVFEVKVARNGKSFPFCELKEHQKQALTTAGRKFIYKIPDLGLRNPCDLIMITESPGYVVIFYPKLRQPKKFYVIEISNIEREIASRTKILTEPRAEEIAYKIGILK